MGKNVFLSYGSGDFIASRDALCESAKNIGFDHVIAMSEVDINQSDFWKKNQAILSQKRGGGYWLWKPYIIRQILESLDEDDVLVYCDAGRPSYCSYNFESLPENLLMKTRSTKKGFLLGPALYQHGSLKKWTKRDCLILMKSDKPEIYNKPIIQATWSFWTPTKESFDFLNEWVNFSCDPRCISDLENTIGQPNYKEFIDHRHDQSIMTLLAYKENVEFLDFSDTLLFKIMNLRPNSRLSHEFLRRIDDCEAMLSGKNIVITLAKSFIKYKSS